MNLNPLFVAIDEKPFRPFEIGLTSEERIGVVHPDTIFLIPNRQTVNHGEVYPPDARVILIWPEALATLHFNGDSQRLDGA